MTKEKEVDRQINFLEIALNAVTLTLEAHKKKNHLIVQSRLDWLHGYLDGGIKTLRFLEELKNG